MITASRLGSSPLTWDGSNLGKLAPADPQQALAAQDAWARLKTRFASGEVGFYDAPVNGDLSQIEAAQALAERILAKNQFTDCLFLGIGGSALGPISLLSALEERRKTALRFHFMENPDPLEWRATLSRLKPESTLVCAVTKSGTTFETIAQLILALGWLGEARAKNQLVAITDPAKGDLQALASRLGAPTLPIAPSIGGRFSVFTPVGLFPAALAGLSTRDFLLGARQVRDYLEKTPAEKSSLTTLGTELIRQFPKRPVHVCMPYSSRLRSLGAWFAQLWGESLGKGGKGFTPLAALGATDQHSVLQLLRDGPDDKVTWFVTLDRMAERAEDEVVVPRLRAFGTDHLPAFKILEGHTLENLLRYEYQATSRVLTRQNRPSLTLQLERLDERAMGALYFALSALTAITGELWGVNPFDQPGVEEGKVYIRESLSEASQGY